MHLLRILLVAVIIALASCSSAPNLNKEIPAFLLKFPRNSFAYPVGEDVFTTEGRDWRDDWYNAQDFGEDRHLGEDWNKNTGGDSDCGSPVFASADGRIVFARDAGPGWGNVVIVEHTAPDGTKLQSLYGHLQSIAKGSGPINRREQLGTIGNANGRYSCHLHFELRWNECPFWNETGPGYSDQKHGWIDPSEFIEKTR